MNPFRWVKNTSLATRLSMVALIVTLVSLTVTATVGLIRGSELADEIADDRFVTVASSRSDAIQAYTVSVRRKIQGLAASPATRQTIAELGDAFRALEDEPSDAEATAELTEFYLAGVVPELEAVRGTRVGAAFLVPDGDAAVHLQNAYTIPRPPGGADDANDDGVEDDAIPISPDLVLDPGDGSTYSSLHPAVHQVYGEIAIQSGFDDLFLIDAEADVLVYSVRKRIDFGTSLDLGPHSGSTFARLIDSLQTSTGPTARFGDFGAYVPASERPTTFVASPVFDGSEIVGYIAASLTVDPFDAILSGNGAWEGFGDSGEVFLVGRDATMRTTARLFQDSPSAYLSTTAQPGPAQLSDAQRQRMARTGTTALVQTVDRRVLLAAQQGPGVVDMVDHLGRDARAAYLPLELDELGWTIFAQIDRDELDRPIEDYALRMLLAVALFVVIVTFVAVRWSHQLMAPVRAIADRLRRVRAATEVGDDIAGDESGMASDAPVEYRELSDNVDQMLERLAERRAAVQAQSRERTSLLRQFLPSAVARRSEETGGEVLDHVQNASVVVAEVVGLGDLVGDAPDREVRDLLGEVVDEVDALAATHGLERIKLTGSTYYAVCGVSRPYLDHAPRAVAFALAARDLVRELTGGRLVVRVGVASGPVSVGLAARSALVYDVWGETVATAESLTRSAPSGTAMATDDVRAQLPPSFVVTGDAGGPVVVGERLTTEETSV